MTSSIIISPSISESSDAWVGKCPRSKTSEHKSGRQVEVGQSFDSDKGTNPDGFTGSLVSTKIPQTHLLNIKLQYHGVDVYSIIEELLAYQ